jgi:hypothetical protein
MSISGEVHPTFLQEVVVLTATGSLGVEWF